ncbi:MAG: MFS transporter [Methanomethylophilus sp.]
MAGEKLFTSNFLLCSVCYFFLTIFFFMFYTGMSTYAVDTFGAAEWAAGLSASIFIIGDLVARIFIGRRLELLGKKRVAVAALALSTLMSLVYFVMDSLSGLIVLRLLHGIVYGSACTAVTTLLSQGLPLSRRGEGMGYFMLSMTVGSAVGPLLCMVLLTDQNYPLIFLIGTLCAFAGALTVVFLRDQPLALSAGQKAELKQFRLGNLYEKTALPIFVISFSFFLAYSGVLTYISPYGQEIGLAGAATWFFVAVSAATLIARLCLGRLYDRYGENKVLIPTFVIAIAGFVLLAYADSAVELLTAGFCIGLHVATLVAIGQVIAIRKTPLARYGIAISTFNCGDDLGYGVGPILLGLLIASVGYRGMYEMLILIAVISLVLYIMLHMLPNRRGQAV